MKKTTTFEMRTRRKEICSMTANQINYQRSLNDLARIAEDKRHNLDVEDMNRNLAVYQAYKMKREGDAAGTKKWENVAGAIEKFSKAFGNLMSPFMMTEKTSTSTTVSE